MNEEAQLTEKQLHIEIISALESAIKRDWIKCLSQLETSVMLCKHVDLVDVKPVTDE